MVEAIVSFGLEKLWDRLTQEYEQFQGVEDRIAELKSNLNLLKSFLKDAEAKKNTSQMVRHCVEEIKEIVYDTENMIETFILKEAARKRSGIIRRITKLTCIKVHRWEFASDIGGISKRISKVIQDMHSFGVQQMISDGSQSSHLLQEREREMRQTFSRGYESDFVGLEVNVKKLVGYLVEEDDIQIVSVTGMGGLGKTTLARQVFNHEDVKHQFDRLAWVCVSQEFTRKNVWQMILQNLTSRETKDEILQMEEAELHDELFQLLETSKSLIVFDDIWKEEDWGLINPIFPPKKGWKVLITSRTETIAMHGNRRYVNFKPECLTILESWILFQRIAMPRVDESEFKVDKEMEMMGKQMIKYCGGLPLAVKVLGGLLAAKYTFHDWKRLSENIGCHIVGRTDFSDGNNSSVYHVLSLSFEELPSYLKHCFLYLAHFPEDHNIKVEKLSYCWAAEGILEPRHYHGQTIRDVGESYIEELVRRNMVIAERDVTTLRFEACHLHDMMREVCLLKAKEENFVQIASILPPTANSQYPGTSRRFVSQNPTTLHVSRDINNPKLQSLLIVWENRRKSWKLLGSSFIRLELLRVLDLYKAKFEGRNLPSGIGKLIHLRYLNLDLARVSRLPSSLGNLRLLIYLDINVCTKSLFVPNCLMGMHELRYLRLPFNTSKEIKLGLCNLVNLETLENFSTENSSLEDLRGMVSLRTLTIGLFKHISKETLFASILGMRHLENLSIRTPDGSSKFKRIMEDGIVLDAIHLKQLNLRLYMPKLPDEQHFPSHLTSISLDGCCLVEDPLPILEKLLELKEVRLDFRAFCGKRMVSSDGGFPQLHRLYIWGLAEWEEWIVEEGSMPRLHTLTIWNCQKLKQLPDGLRFIYSIKDLDMDKKWKEILSEGGEEYYKVQHIPSVKFEKDYK
jgi:hypothetical protein